MKRRKYSKDFATQGLEWAIGREEAFAKVPSEKMDAANRADLRLVKRHKKDFEISLNRIEREEKRVLVGK